jgi:hypothetical protein
MIATEPELPESISRRQFLKGAGALAGGAVVVGGAFETVQLLSGTGPSGAGPPLPSYSVRASGPIRAFHSRPDLRPPTITVSSAADSDDGYLFLGPWGGQTVRGNEPGPLMVDHQAEPVWFNPVTSNQAATHQWGTNFRSWTYRDKPVLGWWEGYVAPGGFGQGQGVLVDSSYQEMARVRAANGRQMDLHEFTVTPEGTALFTCFPRVVQADLSSVGGSRQGRLMEPVFQEVDIRTGRLLLEWRGLDHIALNESYLPVGEPFDFLHLNSVKVASDGHLLVSARHTWAIYKVHRRTGQVMWRLGGKRSDFDLDKKAKFAWQHDAQQPAGGTISVFDNGSDGTINTESRSRGLVLNADEVGRTVKVAQEYGHPKPFLSVAMGSVQVLPSGNVLVGWGTEPYLSDFGEDGTLLADAEMLSGYKSYRSFRLPWKGIPQHAPAIMAKRNAQTGKTTVYASWNGATDVASFWQVHAGPSRSSLKRIGVARRRGFETAIPLGSTGGYFAVTALDEDGSRLGRSAVVSV